MTKIRTLLVALLIVGAAALTATPAQARTNTKAACASALAEADAIIQTETDVVTATGAMFTEMHDAAQRAVGSYSLVAVTGFLQEMTASVQKLNGVVVAKTAEVAPHTLAYRLARSRCLGS